MKKMRRILFAALLGGSLLACCSEEEEKTDPVLSLNPPETRIFSISGSHVFEVTTNQPSWSVRSDRDWCVVTQDRAANTFTVELSAAPTFPAYASVTVTAGEAALRRIDFVARQEEFDKNVQISYPKKEGTYALIVAASSGLENYRHQAGAYLIYQMLKANGLNDDHILLVSEDDVVSHPNSPTPGRILPPSGDGNLHEGLRVDYKPSELGFSGLAGLFAPGSSPSRNDNLFVYWAGKGNAEGLEWLGQTIPAADVAGFFENLSDNGSFRKLFLLLDTDCAGVVSSACVDKNVKGLLCFAGTDVEGLSRGNRRSPGSNRVWLSNAFTDAFYKVALSREVSLSDMYNQILRETNVGVYNAKNFGNLYTSTIAEFLVP